MRTALAIAALLLTVVPAKAGTTEGLVVIVHPERSESLTEAQLAQIYLKQRRFWPEGDAIVPVNRESESDEREIFSSLVFGEMIDKLRVYWHRQYFQGVMPPATLASDAAVKSFVAREKSAIGYIRESAVDATVHVALRLPPS